MSQEKSKTNSVIIRIYLLFLIGSVTIGSEASAQNTFPSSGNVGINTMNPGYPLHVNGALGVGVSGYPRRFVTPTYWGYGSTYRVLMIGSPSSAYNIDDGAVTLSFNYDPANNSNGAFTGHGDEILFRNGTQFVTPNSADNAFNLRNLVLKDGNVGIGLDPAARLDVAGGLLVETNGTNTNTRTLTIKSQSQPQIGFSQYQGQWRSSIQIQSNDNASLLFLAPPESDYPFSILQSMNGGIKFNVGANPGTNALTISSTGNVGIGTSSVNDSYRLTVEGNVRTRKIVVNQQTWADNVFQPDYRLLPLPALRLAIRSMGHLPGVPSEDQISREGNDLGKTDAMLLKKIEELTLYLLTQDQRINQLEKALKTKNRKL